MISFRQRGDFSKLTNFLNQSKHTSSYSSVLEKYGREGVAALSAATPVDTGVTARSWYYKIVKENDKTSIVFCNSNIQNDVPIAIILQYGHGTRNGGWVEGRDYINPSLQPVFEQLANAAWKEVTK